MEFFSIVGMALSFALTLFGAAFLLFEIYTVIIGHWMGAPFVKSAKKKIYSMLALAAIKSGETVVDLGSGDGTLIIEAAKMGAAATGVEINPFLIWLSRVRIRRAGLENRATILRKDFRTHPLGNTDVVFAYLWPSTLQHLKEKFERELAPGARVISNAFPIEGWTPIIESDGVYLYHK